MDKKQAEIVKQKEYRCNTSNPQKCHYVYDSCKECPNYVTDEDIKEADKALRISNI